MFSPCPDLHLYHQFWSQTSRKTRTRLNNRDRNPPITLHRSDTPDKALAVDLIARWRLSFTVVTYLWLTVLNIRLGYQREHRLTRKVKWLAFKQGFICQDITIKRRLHLLSKIYLNHLEKLDFAMLCSLSLPSWQSELFAFPKNWWPLTLGSFPTHGQLVQ